MKLKLKKKNLQTILVVLVLLATFILVYSPHFSYKYPFHGDEWARISYSLTHDTGQTYKPEIGFIYFLGFLGKFVNILWFYRFLPAIFACLASLALFSLVKSTTKNYWISLFSMIFFASLKTNSNILGPWFFVPLTMAFVFVYLYTFFMVQAIGSFKIRYILLTLITLILLLYIHAFSALYVLLVTLVFLLFSLPKIIKNLRKLNIKFIVVSILSAAVFVIIIYFFTKHNLNRQFILKSMVFRFGWTEPQINYNLFFVYGVLPLLVSFLGLFYSFKKKISKVFVSWFIVGIFMFLFFEIKKYTYLIAYERLVYYLLLGFVPLSAIGLYYLFVFIAKKKQAIIAVVIVLSVLISAFYNYYSFHEHKYIAFDGYPKNLSLYKCINNDELFYIQVDKCLYPHQRQNKWVFTPLVKGMGLFEIDFINYSTNNGKITQGDSFDITYVWQSIKKMNKDYRFFVHFLDGKGNIVFHHDHSPQKQTSKWAAGEIFEETYNINIAKSINPGKYSIKIAVGDPDSGEVIPIPQAGNDLRRKVGQIEILPLEHN